MNLKRLRYLLGAASLLCGVHAVAANDRRFMRMAADDDGDAALRRLEGELVDIVNQV